MNVKMVGASGDVMHTSIDVVEVGLGVVELCIVGVGVGLVVVVVEPRRRS